MKPSIPQGPRDFSAAVLRKRNFILQTIRSVFETYGFEPLETPAMENTETLMGKYGEEGDKLIFKILNNGLNNPDKREAVMQDFNAVLEGRTNKGITERALRYDLTIPFARYVAMNQGQLTFPFKRYQMQPVWRADRPQRGRYREFWQCDADVAGSTALLHEVELSLIYTNVFNKLKVPVEIHINNRKILGALAAVCGGEDMMMDITIAIDKLDKIDIEGVSKELGEKFGGAVQKAAQDWLFAIDSSNIPELLKPIWDGLGDQARSLRFDPTLVRGMGYYTGSIFEIEHPGSGSSIGGGGRYDGMVGKWLGTDVPAVGISIGFERVIELVETQGNSAGVVLVLEDGSLEVISKAVAFQKQLIDSGKAVRLEIKPKKLNVLLDSLMANGFSEFALVGAETAELSFKAISN